MLTGRRGVRGRRLPPLSGRSLPPRQYNPARSAYLTRHQQEFPGSRPIPVFPLTCGHPGWDGGPWAFPRCFEPGRSGTGHARHGGDRSSTTRSYVPGISQTSSTSSLTHVRPRVATPSLPRERRCPLAIELSVAAACRVSAAGSCHPGTGHARHGGDRSNTTSSYVSGIPACQTSSTSSLTTRDLGHA